MRIFNKYLATLFLLASILQPALATAQPRVLVSIKPLQLIFSEIAGDAAQVDLLLDPGASPHLYNLKPSDIAKLNDAEALVWIGPRMETFLAKVVMSVKPKRSILLQQELSHHLSHKGDHHEDAHDHGHEDHSHDAHLWLSPELGPEIAKIAAELLSELNPGQAPQIRQRLANFNKSLAAADQSNQELLTPVRNIGFIVTHDAYGRFVEHYGLNQVGALTISPERTPGARHVTQLRQQLESSKARCILLEPQIKPRYMEALTAGLSIREEVIDPLGAEIEPGAGAYARFLTDMAEDIHRCLR